MYNLDNIRRLHIELSSRCNASCGACSRNLSGGPVVPELKLEDLSLEDIKQMFSDGSIASNLYFINYCGNVGDPVMAPDILSILEYFQSVNTTGNLFQQVRTNGGMRNEEFWKNIGNFFASQQKRQRHISNTSMFLQSGVVFSVDGLEDTNHLYRRGVKWEKLFANMQAYASTGATALWEFLIFEHNQHQIEEARALAKSMGFYFITKNAHGLGEDEGVPKGMDLFNKNTREYEYTLYPANYKGERKDSKYFAIKEDYHRVIPMLTEYSSNLGKCANITCKSLNPDKYQEIYVSSSGYLLPCCYLGGVLGHKYTSYSRYQFDNKLHELGLDAIDLRKHSIPDVLNNINFKNLFLDGWKADSVENGKLLFCAEMCGENSKMDTLYNKE